MKITIADILQIKYGLFSCAQEENKFNEILNKTKKQISETYFLYVAPNASTGGWIDQMAVRGEPVSKKITRLFAELVSKLDDLTMEEINKMLSTIQKLVVGIETDESRKVYNAVWDSYIIKVRPRDVNTRAYEFRKFQGQLARLSSIIGKILDSLSRITLIENNAGKAFDPKRQQLGAKEYLKFSKTDAAEKLGLNDLDMLERIIQYPDLQYKLDTIINALNRGHNPRDWEEFKEGAGLIISAYKLLEEKKKSNFDYDLGEESDFNRDEMLDHLNQSNFGQDKKDKK